MTSPETIRTAYAAERETRRKYWLCGQPDAADIAALRKHIARKLRITAEAVEAVTQEDNAHV